MANLRIKIGKRSEKDRKKIGKRSLELEDLWFEFQDTYEITGFKQQFLNNVWGAYAVGNELKLLVTLRPLAEPAIYNGVKALFEDWLLNKHHKKISLTFKVVVHNEHTQFAEIFSKMN
jgi:hypothetical protein